MEDKVGLAWLVQWNATQSGFTEDVYGEEEKDPKPEKEDHQYGNEIVTNAVPKIGSISRW